MSFQLNLANCHKNAVYTIYGCIKIIGGVLNDLFFIMFLMQSRDLYSFLDATVFKNIYIIFKNLKNLL